ncbi:MAG: ACP S-malonyltransferase [Candidatus Omnitrophica bacterium]|nr:ACP S-malonyltransferase [Candidatus Omnitrophota bacterium]
MPYALLFPGQGAQFVGMGKDLAGAFPESRRIFEQADSILGFSLSRICFEGPLGELTRTEICQPALYAASMAALAALDSEFRTRNSPFNPAAAAGLSLGEYTALAAGGALSFEEGLRLVQLRGQAMEEAARLSPGTMASVLGMELEVLEPICGQSGAQVANINAPGQIVISGSPEAVQAASAKAKEQGAKRVVPLEVGGAFHSRLMEPAAGRLEGALQRVQIDPPRFPVMSNVTGLPHSAPDQIRRLLVEQLTRPVRWEACVRALLEMGIRAFLEVGPGTVLKGLCRRIAPEAVVFSVGSAAEVREAALGAPS